MTTLFDIGDELDIRLSGKLVSFSVSDNGDCYVVELTDTKPEGTKLYLDSAALKNAVRKQPDEAASWPDPPICPEASLSDRTVDIITISKRFSSFVDRRRAVIKYMSEECGSNPEAYDDFIIFSVVKEAFLDYLSVAQPVYANTCVRTLLENTSGTDTERMLAAMSDIQIGVIVDNQLRLINGWHNTRFMDKILDCFGAQNWLDDIQLIKHSESKEKNTNG